MILDTHTLIWWLRDDPRLSLRARREIAAAPDVFVSAVSAFEMATKERRGRLDLGRWRSEEMPEELEKAEIEVLPILLAHALAAGHLPGPHRDPFDRMLIAQSRIEGLPIITRDPIFEQYGVEVIW